MKKTHKHQIYYIYIYTIQKEMSTTIPCTKREKGKNHHLEKVPGTVPREGNTHPRVFALKGIAWNLLQKNAKNCGGEIGSKPNTFFRFGGI